MKTRIIGFSFILFIILSISGCATGGKGVRQELRNEFLVGNYQDGLKLLHNSKGYKDQKIQLLLYLEDGLLNHASGRYYQSVISLNKAKDIYRKLYTESLSKKMKSLIANDNYDIYYGETYERSLINFYSALNHFLIYQQGFKVKYGKKGEEVDRQNLSKSERQQELFAARAEIVEWDSFLSTQIEGKKGNSVFKNDLLARTFGAFIHETIGSRQDLQIALQLYKDAKKLIFRNYNAYKTFNTKNLEFKKNFKDLPKLKTSKIEALYIRSSDYQKKLKNFLDFKILQITNEIRPNDFKKTKKIIGASKEVLKKVKNEKFSNVAVVLQKGIIPAKKGIVQYYTLEKALSGGSQSPGVKAVARFGAKVITIFAANQLGLIPPPRNYNPVGTHLGIHYASMASDVLAISFELPEIVSPPIKDKTYLVIEDQSGNQKLKREMVLLNPLGEIAEEAIAEKSGARYLRLGARLAGKHLLAIAASYATYNASKDSMGKFIAKMTAATQYLAASKAIEMSEKADTRYWSTLPSDIRYTNLFLPKGKYLGKLIVENPGTGSKREVFAGEIVIDNPKKKKLINFRIK